jgi:transcriptional regulator with XRE-family HTH domain
VLQRPAQQSMKKTRHSRRYHRLLVVLREIRESAGFTQKDVAAKFGAHASFVSKCESGERRIDVVELADFCRVYGTSVPEVLERADIT